MLLRKSMDPSLNKVFLRFFDLNQYTYHSLYTVSTGLLRLLGAAKIVKIPYKNHDCINAYIKIKIKYYSKSLRPVILRVLYGI